MRTAPNDFVRRLAKAIGVEHCQKATIRLAAGELVTITTESLATSGQADALLGEMEKAKFIVVEKSKPKRYGVWIACSEEMPPDEEFVIAGQAAKSGEGFDQTGKLFARGGVWWDLFSDKPSPCNPTHWMRLPPVPLDERK